MAADKGDRSWVLAQGLLFLAIILAPGARVQWQFTGIAMLVVAVAVLVAAARTLGRALSPFPTPIVAGTLRTDGVFAFVRHPIYAAALLAAAAFALLTHSVPRAVLTVGLLAFFSAKAAHEERLLAQRYPAYDAYARNTKKFIPWIY